MNITIEIIGWLGSALIVGAYALNLKGLLLSSSKYYILANLIGGICFVINTYFHQAYPSLAVNIVWIILAVDSLLRKK